MSLLTLLMYHLKEKVKIGTLIAIMNNNHDHNIWRLFDG